MKSVNRFGLPEPLVHALSSERKRPVIGRYGVTSLIDAPCRRCLAYRHWDELEEEVSEGLWALLGKAAHHVMDISSEEETELKIEYNYGDKQIVGVVDYRTGGRIIDWKITSVFSFLLGGKIEWDRQLNIYAWLLRKLGYETSSLEIYAILRDFSKSDQQKDPANYPKIPFLVKSIPLWSDGETQQYIDDRVTIHAEAERKMLAGEKIDICTPGERWQRPTTYAVTKSGSERATRVLATKEEAATYIAEKGLEDTHSIIARVGSDVRCLNYCGFYPKFCKGGANAENV